MNAIPVSLLMLSLVCLSLGAASTCPDPSDSSMKLEENSTTVLRSFNSLRRGFNLYSRSSVSLLRGLEKTDGCDNPEFPDDDPNKLAALPQSERVSGVPRVTRVSRAISHDFLEVAYKRTCEPCPARQRFLGRFYRNCYVFAPSHQQVRYVTCNRRCFAPCMCSRSYCQRTAYTKVWFFSYCTGSGPFPGGYWPGLNFRYLWLPQDCTCVNV